MDPHVIEDEDKGVWEMKMRSKLLSASAAALFMMGGAAQSADVVIGVPNWPSVNAEAHILKVIMEDNLGLTVELQNGTNPVIFEAMDKGSMHVHPEVWLPNQQNLHDKFVKSNGTVAINPNGAEAFQGMCVAKHTADELGISSITDLTDPDMAAKFDSNGDGKGEIFIGAPGWASTVVEKVRAKGYGYDETLELVEMDESVAYGNLDSAISAKKHWVGFCYSPHHLFNLHELVVLKEPPHNADSWKVVQPTDDPDWLAKSNADSAWKSAYLHIHYAKSLEKDQPQAASLLANAKFTTDQISSMSYALVVEGKDVLEYANEWVVENAELVADWLSK